MRDRIVPYLGSSTQLKDVTPAQLVRMRSELFGKKRDGSENSNASINRNFIFVKSFFSQASCQEVIPADPAHKIKHLKAVSRPSRTLSSTQLKELFFACGEQLKVCVVLDAFTGLRKRELTQLRRKNIKFDGSNCWVDLEGVKTKSGHGRRILVHPAIVQMVRWYVANMRAEDLLFVAPKGGKSYNPRTAWRNVLKRLGFTGFTFHGLRRTCLTQMSRGGAPTRAIQTQAGHASLSQTEHYIDVIDQDLIGASSSLDGMALTVVDALPSKMQSESWSHFGHTGKKGA